MRAMHLVLAAMLLTLAACKHEQPACSGNPNTPAQLDTGDDRSRGGGLGGGGGDAGGGGDHR